MLNNAVIVARFIFYFYVFDLSTHNTGRTGLQVKLSVNVCLRGESAKSFENRLSLMAHLPLGSILFGALPALLRFLALVV